VKASPPISTSSVASQTVTATPGVLPAGAIPPPGPTMAGTTNACKTWYQVISGDSCEKIDALFDITLAEIIMLNPWINSGCTNLQLVEVCVGGLN